MSTKRSRKSGGTPKKQRADEPKEIYLVASGDLRLSANQKCWPAQWAMENKITAAFEKEGWKIIRAHPVDPNQRHGFISSQRMGMEVFKKIPKDARVLVAEAVWQYSYHVLAGLRDQRGPILTVANWDGEWPGLVGLLNLNASLTKMQKEYSSIWSENFDDEFFINGIREWLETGTITHNLSHVAPLSKYKLPVEAQEIGSALAQDVLDNKVIMGIFDEGCMGMYNGIFEDEILNACGIYKERLSQSALLYEMSQVSDLEAGQARQWLGDARMRFVTGTDEATQLTEAQILQQLKMYIAAGRIFHRFGCDIIGIQYQQGLKDSCPASDLAEGLLNNVIRPPIYLADGTQVAPGRAIPHFNEVDQGAAVDALATNRVWTKLGFDPATTLHDIRYGQHYKDDKIDAFVWVFEISGSVPPSHLIGDYAGAIGERQPSMYFPLGGSTIKGVSKPGALVWSRVFMMDGGLCADLGRATVVSLPAEENERRWKATTKEWPLCSAVLHGITRDQMMARHKSNHIQIAYAPTPEDADKALAAKAAMFQALGLSVFICGEVALEPAGKTRSKK